MHTQPWRSYRGLQPAIPLMATITLTDMQYGHLGVSSKAMPGDYAMAVPLYSLYGHLRHFHPISLRNPGYSMEGRYTMWAISTEDVDNIDRTFREEGSKQQRHVSDAKGKTVKAACSTSMCSLA